MKPRISPKNNMLAGKAGQRGFTLFELAVAVSVIAVLAVVLLGRLEVVQQEAERVAVQQTVLALRAGLRMQVLELYARPTGKTSCRRWRGKTPSIGWLKNRPIIWAHIARRRWKNFPQVIGFLIEVMQNCYIY